MKVLAHILWTFATIFTASSYLYPTFLDVYNSAPYYGSYVNYHYLPPPPETNAFDGTWKNTLVPTTPPLNVLSEVPTRVSAEFAVVPLVIVSAENLRVLRKVQIVELSTTSPTMKVKIVDDDRDGKSNGVNADEDKTVDCTPVANVTLDKPLVVYSLRTNIMFPSHVEISDANSAIPIKVGAVMAPVSGKLYVTPDTPVYVRTVFAVPIDPFVIRKKERATTMTTTTPTTPNAGSTTTGRPDADDGVTIESAAPVEPVNVTLLNFPEEVAAPVFQVDEEDDELVNRNPPQVLAPAGIVQSTQPIVSVAPFTNSKESELLTELKEEANKKKI